jgi:hypothetical protein
MKALTTRVIGILRAWRLANDARRIVSVLTFPLMAIMGPAPVEAQQIGHKVLDSLGLFAGSQPDSGLYVVDQFASFGADEVFDRAGHYIPVGLDLDAWSNPIGSR